MDKKLNIRFKIRFSMIKEKAKKIKTQIGALYLASKRPDLPVYAKVASILVVGYALSPFDLIPDFIPVLGYLDDLIIVPLGIVLAIKLIPKDIMNECIKQSENIFKEGKPKNWVVGVFIICLWITILSYFLLKLL